MLQTPFTFYRGSAGVMAADLAATPTLFRTEPGRRRWEEAARRNLATELAELTRP